MTILVRPEAQKGILAAAQWYEDQQSGVGRRFVSEIDAAFMRINSSPEHYPLLYRNLRRALVQKFPYAVYFAVT